jgi:hypothetical protein
MLEERADFGWVVLSQILYWKVLLKTNVTTYGGDGEGGLPVEKDKDVEPKEDGNGEVDSQQDGKVTELHSNMVS